MNLSDLHQAVEDKISSENRSNRERSLGWTKLHNIEYPQVRHILAASEGCDNERAKYLLNENLAYRYSYSGVIRINGPLYEWYDKCFAKKRIKWQNARVEVDLLIRKIALHKCLDNQPTDHHADIVNNHIVENDDGITHDFEFATTQTRTYARLARLKDDTALFDENLIELIKNDIRRRRNMMRSYYDHYICSIEHMEHELNRGRPSNRNLYEYVQDRLESGYRSVSRFIIGREDQELAPNPIDDIVFGSQESNYPAYECEGRPR
jgi:hypothetical protein